MSDIAVFNHPDFGQVRHVMIDEDPWFVLADVCRVLEIKNPRDAASTLDDDEKQQVSPTVVNADGSARGAAPWVVNESGLYSLTLRSRKPQAKQFKKWVTSEVLPSIRKTGQYASQPMTELEQARQYLAAVEEKERLKAALEIAAPKAEVYDEWLESEAIEMTDFAKRIGFTPPTRFTRKLRELSILRKDKTHTGRYRNLPTRAWEASFDVRPVELATGEWIDLALVNAQGQVDLLEELRNEGLIQ